MTSTIFNRRDFLERTWSGESCEWSSLFDSGHAAVKMKSKAENRSPPWTLWVIFCARSRICMFGMRNVTYAVWINDASKLGDFLPAPSTQPEIILPPEVSVLLTKPNWILFYRRVTQQVRWSTPQNVNKRAHLLIELSDVNGLRRQWTLSDLISTPSLIRHNLAIFKCFNNCHAPKCVCLRRSDRLAEDLPSRHKIIQLPRAFVW